MRSVWPTGPSSCHDHLRWSECEAHMKRREQGIPKRCDPPPWPNDWLEWSIVATLLAIPAIITVCLYMLYV